MIRQSTRNQMGNASNPFQGTAKKVLCVCSAGLLRSPTLANVLHKELGYNTRAVGTGVDFALIPITEAHLVWADEIVFVDDSCKIYLDKLDWEMIQEHGVMFTTLNIPDNFEYGDEELAKECLKQYLESGMEK